MQTATFTSRGILWAATSYVGGTATLFVYNEASQQFVRRTTNVKKENGDRAVGTQHTVRVISVVFNIPSGTTKPLTDLPSCSFFSRNEFCLRKPNEQLRNFISGHGFAE
jgi:hypothetical protein